MSHKSELLYLVFFAIMFEPVLCDMKVPPNVLKATKTNGIYTWDPLNVYLYVDLLYIRNFDVSSRDVEMTFDFYQEFTDKRFYDDDELSLSELIDQFWLPDVYVYGARSVSARRVPYEDRIMIASPNGTLRYKQRVSVKVACVMQLYLFPSDEQKCKLQFTTIGSGKDDIKLLWKKHNNSCMNINKHLKLEEFDINEKFECQQCSLDHFDDNPCLEVIMTFYRKEIYYWIGYLMPSMLIIAFSWVAFLLDKKAIGSRCTIGLICSLSLFKQCATLVNSQYAVEYAKLLDYWMIGSASFALLSLFENVVVSFVSRNTSEKSTLQNLLKANSFITKMDTKFSVNINVELRSVFKGRRTVKQNAYSQCDASNLVDYIARLLFPVSFCVFSFFIWSLKNKDALSIFKDALSIFDFA